MSTLTNVLHVQNQGKVEDLFNHSLLVLGDSAVGKTYALKMFISKLIQENKRVGVLDFRQEYEQIVSTLNGLSILAKEVDKQDLMVNPLLHVHFENSILFTEGVYDLGFLETLVEKVDYLIIDEAYLLNIGHNDDNDTLSISEMCSVLYEINPNLKIFLAMQSLDSCKTKEDSQALEKMFKEQLIFYKSTIIRNSSQTSNSGSYKVEETLKDNLLSSLRVGEAVLFKDNQIQTVYSFQNNKD